MKRKLMLIFFILNFIKCDINNPEQQKKTFSAMPSLTCYTQRYQYSANSDTLRLYNDICIPQPNGFLQRIEVNIYSIVLTPDSLSINFSNDTFQNKSALVKYYWSYSRCDDGTTINGTWNLNSITFISSIQLSNEDSNTVINKIKTLENKDFKWLNFSKNFLTIYNETNGESPLINIFKHFQDSLDKRVDITIDQISVNKIKVTSSSLDSVLILMDSIGNIKYTWNDSEHTYYLNPSTCPNNKYPGWLSNIFLTIN